jgi:hypothetical protein
MEETINILTKLENIRVGITKKNNKIDGFVLGINDEITEALKYDHEGNLFLRYESGIISGVRFLIFFADFKMLKIYNAKILLIDGTFKVVPHGVVN